MAPSIDSSDFLSLKHCDSNGHSNGHSTTQSAAPFSSLGAKQIGNGNGIASLDQTLANGLAKIDVNGSNGTSGTNGINGHHNSHNDDEFLRLDQPQQDLLLLHGPRQKYTLEKARGIPELRGDDEILVQTLAIGLNPVDWKGADYGFGQPSYPWVNGRDFAGIVVKASRKDSRIKQGDVVFGPSTDYRDVRKAAYQEYIVTTHSNVARIPQGVQVKEGAALGVAFVAATIALGLSFGLDLSASGSPDFLGVARGLNPLHVPDDIRSEVFWGITEAERPKPGEWIAIWGANTTTGQLAVQLAKIAGLKVAAVADLAKAGSRLVELGADFQVDRHDPKRAVDILKAVTGGKLRFGFDVVGTESATALQDALQKSTTGPQSHLLGLSGFPKEVTGGVTHHKVPIKLFHESSVFGEALVGWLEKLLISKTLKLPEVEVAEGGLAGINDALDRLRSGTVSGKRIVVQVGERSRSNSGVNTPPALSPTVTQSNSYGQAKDDLSYHDKINAEPDRLKFAYWVPNVSGGLVTSKVPQRTGWDYKSNVRYAQTAEKWGFEYALSQIRFMAGYGAANQHEPASLSHALLAKTEKLKLIVALLPGPWNPAVAAKQIASIDHFTDGRVAVNIVSGWFKLEFTSIGQWWLDHSERYRRSREFIQCLKGIWTQDNFTFKGDFYQFHDYTLAPKPLVLPNRPWPEIFQGGNSVDARENCAVASDYYL
jgi:NADPH:quinone reductase-like Zn-dependent oxidoreductase